MQKLGAIFGTIYGWERPNWFAPSNDYEVPADELDVDDVLLSHNHAPADWTGKVRERWSFRRSNYFEHVGNECRNVMENVGLLDMSAFAKCFVTGPGAEAWLGSILANRIPKKAGRVNLCHLLTTRGGVRSEFTVSKTMEGGYYLVSAGALERHDHDVLMKLLPNDGSVRMYPITSAWGVLVLAGPRSREVLAKVTDADLSNAAFPWLSAQRINVGFAEAHAMRVNFVGELGWELHHPIEMQNAIFDRVMEAGAEFGIKPFGIRAMVSMAIEKSYRLVPRELSIEYTAYESGLDRFVHPNKGDFLGRDALVKAHADGDKWKYVTLEVHGVTDADARGNEPIWKGDELVGRATSGGYGWRVGKSLALAMVRPEHGAEGEELDIQILGERHKATVIPESPYDPENTRLRG
jgi:dimethylglycine dehydrogenase